MCNVVVEGITVGVGEVGLSDGGSGANDSEGGEGDVSDVEDGTEEGREGDVDEGKESDEGMGGRYRKEMEFVGKED